MAAPGVGCATAWYTTITVRLRRGAARALIRHECKALDSERGNHLPAVRGVEEVARRLGVQCACERVNGRTVLPRRTRHEVFRIGGIAPIAVERRTGVDAQAHGLVAEEEHHVEVVTHLRQ